MLIEQPLLTIGLPLYRSGFGAKRAFLSAYLAASANASIEVVVCDNNPSADRSYIHALTCPQVRYIQNPSNLGAAANFYRVYRAARGRFILFLGDDDCLSPHFAEVIADLSESAAWDDATVIASAPTFIMPSKAQETHPPQPSYLRDLQSPSSVPRIKTFKRYTHYNYLYYSIINRDRVDMDSLWLFWALCPGYITALDWGLADGMMIHHPIRQLLRGYYIYNMTNWQPGSGWIAREIKAMREWIKPDLNAQLDDRAVWKLRAINIAATHLGYLLSLEPATAARGGKPYEADRMLGIRECMQAEYLRVIPDFRWDAPAVVDAAALFHLLDALTTPLVRCLVCGEELSRFLRSAARGQVRIDAERALALMVQRFAGKHHVVLE